MKNTASFEPVQPEQVKFIVNNNQINNNDSRIRVKQNKVIHVIVYSVVGLLLIGGLVLLIFLLTNSSESKSSTKTNISSVNSASIFEPVPSVDRIAVSPVPNFEPIPVNNGRSTPAPRTVSNTDSNSVLNSVPNPASSTSQSIVSSSTKNPIPTSVPTPLPIFNPIPIQIPTQNSKLIPTIPVNSIQMPKSTQSTTPCPCAAAKPVSLPVPDAVHKPSSNSDPIKAKISFSSYSIPKSTKVDSELEKKRQLVKDIFLESWNAYREHAWGNEALSPMTNSSYSETFGDNTGLTIVTSMSTLWTMGLKKEFEEGKAWIRESLDLSSIDSDVRVFDTVTHYVGGLLSCYALTGDSLFLNKAFQIAQLVEPAFKTQTGIPYEQINLKTRNPMDENPMLSNIAGFKLDFDYLSDVSSNPTFRSLMDKIYKLLHHIERPRNLYYSIVNIDGSFANEYSSAFADSREYFINLVKSYIQSNRNNVKSIELYKKTMDELESVAIFQNSAKIHYRNPPLNFAQGFDAKTNTSGNYMEYSACYLGAMMSMGSNSMKKALQVTKLTDFKQNQIEKDRIARHWQLGENFAETCYQASSRRKTELGPSAFYLYHGVSFADQTIHYVSPYKDYKEYLLSPELAESYFILWRLTHNSKYRDYAWKMVEAINKYCKVENGGYSGIRNVDEIPVGYVNHQSPLFMSATLKYLYLTFTDDTELQLDHWVFNSVGHPLPICGQNPANPKSICKH